MDVQHKVVTSSRLRSSPPFSCGSKSITSTLATAKSSLNSSAAYFERQTVHWGFIVQHFTAVKTARYLSHQIWTSVPFLSSSYPKNKCNLPLFLYRHFLVTMECSVQAHSVWQHVNSLWCRADSKWNVTFTEEGSTMSIFRLTYLELAPFTPFPCQRPP